MMATIRKTIYRCDICSKQVNKKSDLWKQRIVPGNITWSELYYGRGTKQGLWIEMCETCEKEFVANLMEFTDNEAPSDLLRPRLKKEFDAMREEIVRGEAETTVT